MVSCPECGATWTEQRTCQVLFHQMLFWEAENPSLGVVHHLMVLGYNLQHPSLLSPEGLGYSIDLLKAFIEQGVQPQAIRKQRRAQVDSRNRKWKVTASADRHGTYPQPMLWSITAADVVAGGADNYVANVRRWAQSINAAIQQANAASRK